MKKVFIYALIVCLMMFEISNAEGELSKSFPVGEWTTYICFDRKIFPGRQCDGYVSMWGNDLYFSKDGDISCFDSKTKESVTVQYICLGDGIYLLDLDIGTYYVDLSARISDEYARETLGIGETDIPFFRAFEAGRILFLQNGTAIEKDESKSYSYMYEDGVLYLVEGSGYYSCDISVLSENAFTWRIDNDEAREKGIFNVFVKETKK